MVCCFVAASSGPIFHYWHLHCLASSILVGPIFVACRFVKNFRNSFGAASWSGAFRTLDLQMARRGRRHHPSFVWCLCFRFESLISVRCALVAVLSILRRFSRIFRRVAPSFWDQKSVWNCEHWGTPLLDSTSELFIASYSSGASTCHLKIHW